MLTDLLPLRHGVLDCTADSTVVEELAYKVDRGSVALARVSLQNKVTLYLTNDYPRLPPQPYMVPFVYPSGNIRHRSRPEHPAHSPAPALRLLLPIVMGPGWSTTTNLWTLKYSRSLNLTVHVL